MRRVVVALVVSTLCLSASACALDAGDPDDPDGVQADDVAATPRSDREMVTSPEAAPDQASLERAAPAPAEDLAADPGEFVEEPPVGTNRITYYDGCRKVHQACHCQNTGWAGFCAYSLVNYPDIVMRCKCD
jgi:hypothetical protein